MVNVEFVVVIFVDFIGFSFSWINVVGEIIVIILMVIVIEVGWYFFSLMEDNNGCIKLDFVLVVLDDDFLEVVIVLLFMLSCSCLSVDLDGSGSSFGNGIIYEWLIVDGMLLGSGMGLIDSVGSIGIYVLMVSNVLNGCSSSDSVIVV